MRFIQSMQDWLKIKKSFYVIQHPLQNIPGGSVVKNTVPMQETQVWYLGREDPLEKKMATHSSVFAREIPWQRSLVCYSLRGHKRVRHDLATKQHQQQSPITAMY